MENEDMKEEGDTPSFPPPHPHLQAPATLGGIGTAVSERKRTREVPPITQPLEVDNGGCGGGSTGHGGSQEKS